MHLRVRWYGKSAEEMWSSKNQEIVVLVLRESICVRRQYFERFFRNFFSKELLKIFNELYVILKVYFSVLLSNFFKRVIWSLIFTQSIVSGLLKKWWWNCRNWENSFFESKKHFFDIRSKNKFLWITESFASSKKCSLIQRNRFVYIKENFFCINKTFFK